jgi:hypothetical protein
MEFIVVNLGGEVVEDEKKATHIITDRNPEHIKFSKNKVPLFNQGIRSTSMGL